MHRHVLDGHAIALLFGVIGIERIESIDASGLVEMNAREGIVAEVDPIPNRELPRDGNDAGQPGSCQRTLPQSAVFRGCIMRNEVSSVGILLVLESCRPVRRRLALVAAGERLQIVEPVADLLPDPDLLVEWSANVP